MRKRGRVWRVGKWAGAVGCCIVFALMLFTTMFTVRWQNSRLDCKVGVGLGAAFVGWQAFFEKGLSSGDNPGWNADRTANDLATIKYQWGRFALWPRSGIDYPDRYVSVPLWLVLALLACPTAWLWFGDRRRIPAGHCRRCGYDLTKNESGVCPECGVRIARQVTREQVSR